MNGFISKYRWIIIIVAFGLAATLLISNRQADEPVAIVVEEPEAVETVAEVVAEPPVEPEEVVEPEPEPEAEVEIVEEPSEVAAPEEMAVEAVTDVDEPEQEEPVVVETVVEEELVEAVVEEAVVESTPEVQEPEPELEEPAIEEAAPVEPTVEETPEVVEEAQVEVVEEPSVELVEEVIVVEPVIVVTEDAEVVEAPVVIEVPAVIEPVAEEVAEEITEDTSEVEAVVEDLTSSISLSSEGSTSEEGIKPSFDVVRVDNAGSAVIAGSAEPYSKVVITSNGEEIGEAIAGGSGEFVAIIQVPENDQGQTLELESEVSGQLLFSDETILILPVMRSDAADTVVEESAPPIIRATEDEVVILQGAPRLGIGQVSLDSISYDENDEVVLAGRGSPNSTVIIYVDDTPLMDTVVSESGSWKQALHGLDAGRYVLRVDEIDEDGNVTSRVESPFQREYPEDVREAKAANDTTYTVQPGNSLWVIATGRYGDGMQYHQIFSANKDQIRDPDLIYPGQVFAMPENKE